MLDKMEISDFFKRDRIKHLVTLGIMFILLSAMLLIYYKLTNRFVWEIYGPCLGYILGIGLYKINKISDKHLRNFLFAGIVLTVLATLYLFLFVFE
jgi:hypothetical protein